MSWPERTLVPSNHFQLVHLVALAGPCLSLFDEVGDLVLCNNLLPLIVHEILELGECLLLIICTLMTILDDLNDTSSVLSAIVFWVHQE